MTNNEQRNVEILLSEILPLPADKIIVDRFVSTNEAASCGGRCETGTCRAFV